MSKYHQFGPNDYSEISRMLELPNRREDYQLTATLVNEGGRKLKNLRAKIFLPQRDSNEEPAIYILPTKAQAKIIKGCYPLYRVFRFIASRKDSHGKLVVSSDAAYTLQISTQPWDKGKSEVVWKAVPLGIKVHTPLNDDSSITEVRFWITPSSNLDPVMLITNDWLGHRRVKRHYVRKFKLNNGLELRFDKHFDFDEDNDGNDVIKSHMVAVTDFKKDAKASRKIDTQLLREIDDFLLIAGLAVRTHSYCYGWQAFDILGITSSFRGDVKWPGKTKIQDKVRDDELVDRSDHRDFIKTAYRKFVKDTSKDLLRDAIYANLPSENLPIESIYTNIFSGIETLVLAFRRSHGIEFIFDGPQAEEWADLRDHDLKAWFKSQPLFADSDKRARLYENLAGLDRVSFSHAFKSFCSFYNLDLSDLWPITGGGDKKWSLTTIRNKLVHGDVLGPHKLIALDVATAHLKWTLERMLLVYLGWDVSRSRVPRNFLSLYNKAHKNMDNYRSTMSS